MKCTKASCSRLEQPVVEVDAHERDEDDDDDAHHKYGDPAELQTLPADGGELEGQVHTYVAEGQKTALEE